MSVRDRTRILADVTAHPELDEPRLEFAQAIANSDPAWADFIQRSLVRGPFGYESVRGAEDLERRLLAPLKRFGDITAEFHRGFIQTIYVSLDAFVRHGNELLDLAPIVEVRIIVSGDSRQEARLVELMGAPAIGRVLSLSFGYWPRFDFHNYKTIIESTELGRLVKLETPDTFRNTLPSDETDAAEAEMWPALFASSDFRRMIDWGLPMTRQSYGDRLRIESPDSDYWETLTYEPMPPADRELEQRYGYIPRLHAGNWGASVLDVLRGKKPDFPVGARPVESMYVVPAPVRRRTTPVEY